MSLEFESNFSSRIILKVLQIASEQRGGAQRVVERNGINTEIPFLALHTTLLTIMWLIF